jgi:hypothetical protein
LHGSGRGGIVDPIASRIATDGHMPCTHSLLSEPRARPLRLGIVSSLLLALLSMCAAACESPESRSPEDEDVDGVNGSPNAGAGAKREAGAASSDGRPDGGAADAARASASDAAEARLDARTSAPQRDGKAADAAPTPPSNGDARAMAAPAAPSQCGDTTRKLTPFGCTFAWGTNDPVSALPNAAQLGFVSKWVGYETDKGGTLARCDGCSWLTTQFASGSSIPVYYAYFIGFLGSANGFADQNVNPNGPNLATDGAQLIRDQRAQIIEMYASYAKQSARVWPDKPLVWLLEGDFVQYTYKEQKGALSMVELAALARDITCAIKGNMPNAVVAINHTTWLSDELTNSFWDELESAGVNYDLVWTTGVANNMGLLERDAKPGIYNQATATYDYVARKTGRKILVDTSFGLSGMSDTWASATAAVLNERIAEGVIAANVTMPPASYVDTVQSLSKQLSPVCK